MNQRARMRQRFSSQPRIGAAFFASPAVPARPSIELRIHELALIGADFTAHRQIAGMLQIELARLVSKRGLPQRALAESSRGNIDGDTISIEHGDSAKKIGNEIARAIYGGLRAGGSIGN